MVLVTGGTGFIGGRLVRLLAQAGCSIRALTRRAASVFPPQVQSVQGSLTDGASLTAALQGVEVVFHTAGEKRNPVAMAEVNVTGTAQLLDACLAAGVKTFIYLGSAGVIGPTDRTLVSEDTPGKPSNEYEQTKYKAEQLVLGRAADLSVAVLRPTDVIGDGDPEQHLRTLWLTIKANRFIYLGPTDAWLNYVYVEDCARAMFGLAQALSAGEIPSGGVYIQSDPCRMYELVDLIADQVGVPRPRLVLPSWVGWPLAWIGDKLKPSKVSFPITSNKMRAMANRTVFDATRLNSVLKSESFVGWREGIRRTMAWYQSE